jgi:hypothetical protein
VFRRYQELWYALVAIAATTALYVLAYRQAGTFPSASGLVGHGIGIVGFILMAMTATLYTIRKLATDASWGSMAGWLRFHMVTGVVGPYMVLLHTAMRFQGLAGVAMLLTVVVVISGLVGRYIYTTVPRVVEGAEPDVSTLDPRFARYEVSSTTSAVALDPSPLEGDAPGDTRAATASWRSLDQRLDRLAARRRALATWRSIHVPLTWALLVTALIHTVGAIYYAVR